jgi:hypothetical protein
MALLDRIRAALRREPPASAPRLRNRVGGMAWVNARVGDCGAEVLVGRAVKIVALNPSGKWRVDPPQQYIATAPILTDDGRVALPGDRVLVLGFGDATLAPWKEDGDGVTDAEVRKLYEPPIPLRVRGTTSDL